MREQGKSYKIHIKQPYNIHIKSILNSTHKKCWDLHRQKDFFGGDGEVLARWDYSTIIYNIYNPVLP